MQTTLTILSVIVLIPMVLLIYALISGILQKIFNSKYNADAHDTKWQLKSKAINAVIVVGFFSLFSITATNIYYISACNIASMMAMYWYGFVLAKHNLSSLFSKLS